MIISKNEIFVLLNHYYLKNNRKLKIVYPPFNLPLFTLNLHDFKIEDLLSRRDFEFARRKYATREFLREDLPDYGDLKDVFLSSGVIDFENREEINENFNLLRSAVKERTIYTKPVFLGIDTNIAYYRVISRRIRNLFKYVISEIVVEEVDRRIHTKYTGKMLSEFEELPYHNIMYEFSNGSVKDARKAKNAMNEIYYLTNFLDAYRTGAPTETKDKEIRDREIVESYRKFSDEINAEVVVLTADKDMVFHSQARQLSSIYFKLPHDVQADKIDANRIPDMIYDLVTVFGIIQIGNTVVLGEWRGKDANDYFNERLKIYNMEDVLAREIMVCRGVINELQGNES